MRRAFQTDLETTVALFALNLIETSELPDRAALALAQGVDTPALRKLAGLTQGDVGEARTLLHTAFEELGHKMPTESEAAHFLGRNVASRIVSGELEPFEGARMMGTISRAVRAETFHALDDFIYAESEAEDRPEDQDFFAEQIMAAARGMLQL